MRLLIEIWVLFEGEPYTKFHGTALVIQKGPTNC